MEAPLSPVLGIGPNMEHWDGTERRSGDRDVTLETVMEVLHRLELRMEAHLLEEEAMKPYLVELIDVLQKSKGAITFLKIMVYVGGAIAAAIAWGKDHIKW